MLHFLGGGVCGCGNDLDSFVSHSSAASFKHTVEIVAGTASTNSEMGSNNMVGIDRFSRLSAITQIEMGSCGSTPRSKKNATIDSTTGSLKQVKLERKQGSTEDSACPKKS